MRVVGVVLLALGVAAQEEEEAAMLQLEEQYGEELERYTKDTPNRYAKEEVHGQYGKASYRKEATTQHRKKSYKKGAPRRYRKASHRKKAPQQKRKASYRKDAPKRYRKATYSHKVSYTKEAPTQQYRQVSYMKDDHRSYMKDDHRSYMKDDHRSYMMDDHMAYTKEDDIAYTKEDGIAYTTEGDHMAYGTLAKCSTISMSADFCEAGTVYDIGNSMADCFGEACDNGVEADVTACCKVGTRAECSTIAMSADFCGAGQVYDIGKYTTDCLGEACVYDCSKSTAVCVGEACDNGVSADVTACCKMLPPCAMWLVDFVLVLDESGSMKKPLPNGSLDVLKAFAKELVSQYPLGWGAARFSVVSFASVATTRANWSTDIVAIEAAIDQMMFDNNTGTSISGGFEAAGLLFNDARLYANKVVLLITDGEQNTMGGLQKAINASVAVKNEDVTVFAWGFEQNKNTALLSSLQMFATDPCKAVLVNKVADLSANFEGLQADLCHAPLPYEMRVGQEHTK